MLTFPEMSPNVYKSEFRQYGMIIVGIERVQKASPDSTHAMPSRLVCFRTLSYTVAETAHACNRA